MSGTAGTGDYHLDAPFLCLWADKALISNGISIESRNSAACFITGMSEVLPMIIDTIGFILH